MYIIIALGISFHTYFPIIIILFHIIFDNNIKVVNFLTFYRVKLNLNYLS